MHNIKEIRADFDHFKNQLKSRNIDIDIDKIKELDEKNRKYINDTKLSNNNIVDLITSNITDNFEDRLNEKK